MSRHLLYHIFPLAANSIWEWNLDQLIPRLPLFDGVRACSIVTQDTKIPYTSKARPPDKFRVAPLTIPAERVIEKLRPHGFKFFVLKNDPNVGEVKSLYPLLKCVKPYQRADDYTLYAHAKGVTRFMSHPAIPWARMMYETYMDYWPVVEKILERALVAGSFAKWGACWPGYTDIAGRVHEPDSLSSWHYSGSWFWFRNTCLFSQRDWWKVDRFWAGIEAYPSLHFDESQAGAIFHEGDANMNLYDFQYLKKVDEELNEWKSQNKDSRTDLSFPNSWYANI